MDKKDGKVKEKKDKTKEKQVPTLSRKLAVPMLIVTLLQCGIFLCAIIFSGTTQRLEADAYGKFVLTTDIRGSSIENMLVQNIKQSQQYEPVIAACIENIGLPADELEIILSRQLVSVLRRTGATGAYIILENKDDAGNNIAVFLCDDDPTSEQISNQDIMFVLGDQKVRNITSLRRCEDWAESTSTTHYPFYRIVRDAAIENPKLHFSDLGYFGEATKVYPKATESMTYTMPIFDDNHNFLGVIGVEISLPYLKTLMPYKELTSTMRSAYVLGRYNEKHNQISPVVAQGPIFTNMYLNKALQLTNNIAYNNVCEQPNSGITSKALITYQKFDLYSERSPFKNQVWAFAGIIDNSILLEHVYTLHGMLLITVIIIMVVSVAGILLTSYLFSKPIKKLVGYLRSYNPEKEKLNLPKLNISEIDQLSERISAFNDEVTHAASRLSQILSLSNVPIGAIEFDPKTDLVFCTEAIPKLMKFPEDKHIVFRYFSKDFKKLTENFYLHTRPYRNFDDEQQKSGCSTLQFTNDFGESSWVKIQTMQRGSKKITVVQDVSENVREKIKLEYERDYDSLTNLRNRRSFHKVVGGILKERNLGMGAMVMWDMDNLKFINDHYGHDTGDKYLSEAARMFGTLNSNRGVVARMSGDEFYAFLYNFDTKDELYQTIERLHDRMRKTVFVPPDGQSMHIRASGGIAWFPEDSEDYDSLVKYADFAMYNVKNTCRGELMEFDRTLFERDAVLINGREALNRFIENRMLKYAFQPIVDAQTGEIFAYEALMRPNCPELSSIHEVMRLATSQSRLHQIEQLTVFGVLETVDKMPQMFGDAKIFINSIPNTTLGEKDIKLIEKRYSQYTSRLVVEIIESEQSDVECMKIKRRAAKRWGAQIALDDYGAGYSTQASLLVIKPQYIKIDMQLIRNIDTDKSRRSLVENIVTYAMQSGMKTIAEGVETETELEAVISIGVDFIQGFYFSQAAYQPEKVQPEKKTRVVELAMLYADNKTNLLEANKPSAKK